MRFAVLYETTGRFGRANRSSQEHWASDLDYLDENYFRHPNYLRIDGRPVLFVYLTRVYFRNQPAELIEEAKQRVGSLYVVADDVFGADYRAEWAQHFDAVTAYDVYGQSTAIHGTTQKAIEALAANYRRAARGGQLRWSALIPAVAPGFNDTVIRTGHPATARYFSDRNDSEEGDVFREMIRRAALPNLDDRCGRLMMVTSFNEWYEDTQIEATAGSAATTTQDQSLEKKKYTAGSRFEDYSNLYLDTLRDACAEGTIFER